MRSRHRDWVGFALPVMAVVVLAGCAVSAPPHSNSSGPSASSSATPGTLTTPGSARAAIDELMAAAGTHRAVKVDITPLEASLSIVRNGNAYTWAWTNGVVAPAQSDIADVNQASFDPTTFNIDNVGELFQVAADVSGSRQNQELQIVEYNQGQVLMTVTTNPESATVFFRPDGTLVHTVDFATAAGISEALRDCVGNATQAGAIGYNPGSGLYVDLPGSQPGVIDVVTRPKSLPQWAASEKGQLPELFDVSLVQPAVIARIVQLASIGAPVSPSAVAPSAGSSVSPSDAASVHWVIDRRDKLAQPVLRVTAHDQTRAFTLDGTEVTALVGG